MYKFLTIFLITVALAAARPGNPDPRPKPEDRQRETNYKIEDPGVLNIQHREKLFEDSAHRVDGTAVLKKDFFNKVNPTQVGGRVDYNYKPANTNVGLEAVNAGRFGTQVGVEAVRNVYKGRDSALDVGVNYSQHFGGPGGRSEPFFGGFVKANF